MFSALYGNETLKNDLIAALRAKRLAHAYIIEGPSQSGKHTLAKAIACALARTQGDDAFLEKIERDLCPDIMTYGKSEDRKTISVELVRRVKESVYLQPVELSFKLYILEDTELMTPQAQNALLKLLEEPPPQVYFLLLCESAASLLATVRSRAPALRTERFSEARLGELLLTYEPTAKALSDKDSDAFSRTVREAQGSYGAAKALLTQRQSKKEQTRRAHQTEMLRLFCARDTLSVCTAVGMLSQKREEMVEELSALALAVAQILLCKKGSGGDSLYAEYAQSGVSVAAWLALYEAIDRTLEALGANANVYLQQMSLTYAAVHALQGTPAVRV